MNLSGASRHGRGGGWKLETRAADELSRGTFVNIMGQYHLDNQVTPAVLGQPDDRARSARYADIERRISREEMEAAFEAAGAAGLWRFDGGV